MSSVKNTESSKSTESLIWALLHTVPDPDIPVISIVDLGIVRNVEWKNEIAIITITPSYSGCPAMSVFVDDIRQVLNGAGFQSEIKTVLSPAWTTEWISQSGLDKMKTHGIAPPEDESGMNSIFAMQKPVTCPRCNSKQTKMLNRFGSTPCKALWYCNECSQPFEYFKCH